MTPTMEGDSALCDSNQARLCWLSLNEKWRNAIHAQQRCPHFQAITRQAMYMVDDHDASNTGLTLLAASKIVITNEARQA
jgi:hypothetical protein